MGTLIRLIHRSLRMYIRRPGAIALTFSPVLLLALLYPLFLSDFLSSEAVQRGASASAAGWFADAWIAAAFPVALAYTTAMGVLSSLLHDRRPDRERDFALTPVPAGIRSLATILSTLLSALAVAEIVYILLQAAIGLLHNVPFDLREWVFGAGYTALAALQAAAVCLLLASLFRSYGIYVLLSAAAGLLAGFASGVFLPFGMMPDTLSAGLSFWPGSHATAILRQALTMRARLDAFGSVEAERAFFGLDTLFGYRVLSALWSLLYQTGVTLVGCAGAFFLILRRRKAHT